VGTDAVELLAKKTEVFISQLTSDAEKLASHTGRKSIQEEDIKMASKKN